MKIVSKAFVEEVLLQATCGSGASGKISRGYHCLKCLPGGRSPDILHVECMRMPRSRHYVTRIFSEEEISFWSFRTMGSPEQQTVNQQLLRMHRETGIDLVATNDVHYTMAEDAEPHDVLLCLQTQKKLSDENENAL